MVMSPSSKRAIAVTLPGLRLLFSLFLSPLFRNIHCWTPEGNVSAAASQIVAVYLQYRFSCLEQKVKTLKGRLRRYESDLPFASLFGGVLSRCPADGLSFTHNNCQTVEPGRVVLVKCNLVFPAAVCGIIQHRTGPHVGRAAKKWRWMKFHHKVPSNSCCCYSQRQFKINGCCCSFHHLTVSDAAVSQCPEIFAVIDPINTMWRRVLYLAFVVCSEVHISLYEETCLFLCTWQ